jgi:hypothetical protein
MRPSAAALREAARINEALAAFLPGGRIAAPKGIYRWRSLEEANERQRAWLAEAMAEARAARAA